MVSYYDKSRESIIESLRENEIKKEIKFEAIKKASETRFKLRNIGNIKELESASPPSVFIGSKLRYPAVNVGILSPLHKDENAWVYDAEKYWADENYGIGDVVRLRDSLLNSRFQAKVSDVRSISSSQSKKFLEIAREIGIAHKPVDIELGFKKTLKLRESGDRITTPHGMRASMEKAKIIGNVKVHNKVEKIVNDDLKASASLKELYKNNFDVYSLSKLLSIGVLGMKKNRKLVPTRWSITSADDTIGKSLIKDIKSYRAIENYELFYGNFMGNYYVILLFPSIWSYELFELYEPGSSWNPGTELKASTDNETYDGRKEYASNTAGGYYASRLGVLEHLSKIKKQASVLAIRLESKSYWAALGVWVVRESVRKTMGNKNYVFESKEELVSSCKSIAKNKIGFNAEPFLERSKLLESLKTQQNLAKWL